MAARFIFESSGGLVGSSLERDGAIEPLGAARPFDRPLSDTELADLAWYFDVYPLTATSGGHFRASQVEARMATWGRRLFDSLFPADSPALTAWNDSVGTDRSVWLVGGGDGFLSLPWELARASDAERPLGQWARLTRLPATPNRHDRLAMRAPKRALVVISRPEGTPAISYLLFGRGLLAQLGPGGAGVDVEVLRPPTFETFRIRLQAARNEGRPYDIIHFDGHGGVSRSKDGSRVGHLTFESAGGSARHIDTESFGAALGKSGAPLVVLAACHSGDVAGAESSIAASLVRSGAARAVVAMSHAVCTDAARLFLVEFYRGVVTGRPLGQAVCDGRQKLADLPIRVREHGEVRLQDWVVPVLYSDAPVAFAGVASRLVDQAIAAVPGRDAAYFALERLLQRTRSAGVVGLAGSGKTTFARDAAGWLAATTPGHAPATFIDASGCEGPAGLARRIGEALSSPVSSLEDAIAPAIGPVVIDGLNVARWCGQDREKLVTVLKNRPIDAAAVIVTARGNALSDAGLASVVMQPLPPDVLRSLLPDSLRSDIRASDFVDGHPATAVNCAPAKSEETFPVDIHVEAIAQARSAVNMLPPGSERQLRLIAGNGPRLEFQNLKHLTNYFAKNQEASVPIVELEGVERGSFESWEPLIQACIDVGLAERIDGDIYRLHPALGPALVEAWRLEEDSRFAGQWSALQSVSDDALLATASQLTMLMQMAAGLKLGDGEASPGLRLLDARYIRAQLDVLEARIRDAVIRAVGRGMAGFAGLAAQALGILWGETGRRDVAFCERVVTRMAEQSAEARDVGGVLQWVMLQQIAIHRGQTSLDIVSTLRALLDRPEVREREGRPSYGDWLLVLAQALDVRGRAAEAEPVARQAVQLLKQRDDPDEARRAEHSLGTILRNLGRGGVTTWTPSADDLAFTPADYLESTNSQAVRAFDQGDFKRATELQLQVLKASDASPRQRARAMHELGLLCEKQGKSADAERWFLQSLAIKESRLPPGESVRTHQMLASFALNSGRLDEAAAWFEKSLEFADAMDTVSASSSRFGLAEIARRRGERNLAVDQAVTGLARFATTGLPENGTELGFVKRVFGDSTALDIESAWARVQGQAISWEERVGLSECLGRLGLHSLAADLSAPAQGTDESTLVARALLLQAAAIGMRIRSNESDSSDVLEAGRVLEEAVRRFRAEDSLPRPLVRALGEALLGRAAFLCAAGEKDAGLSVAREAAEVMEVFREGPETEGLMDYARVHELIGMACRDLGRWSEAATAFTAEAEAYRLCSAANEGYRPRRFEALQHAAETHLRSDDAKTALECCSVFREEMDRAYAGSAACEADPSMGVVIQLTHDCLSRLGDMENACKVVADRLSEIDNWVDRGSPKVFNEFATWTILLLGEGSQPNSRLVERLGEVAARRPVDEFSPRYSSPLAHAAWESLQADQPAVAEQIRSLLADLESRAPERLDLRVALARVDFDRTIGRGKRSSVSDDEAIASRLEPGILSFDGKTGDLPNAVNVLMRYGFAMEHAVGKRLQAGEQEKARALADAFESLVTAMPKLMIHALRSLASCRRNLIVASLAAKDVRSGTDQVRRVLALAILGGDSLTFSELDYEGDASDTTFDNPGKTMVEAVGSAIGLLVQVGSPALAAAKELLGEFSVAVERHPHNDLVSAMTLVACSNLLMRIEISADDARLLEGRTKAAMAARQQPGLISRALPLILMARVLAERRRGDLATARTCLGEMVAAKAHPSMGTMIAYAGLGIAGDLAQKGEKSEFVNVVRQVVEGIQGCEELDPQLGDVAGASDQAIQTGFELSELEDLYHIVEGLRGLLTLYPGSLELRQTVAFAITNLVAYLKSPCALEGWVSDLLQICTSKPVFDRQLEVLVAGAAHAMLPLDAAGLGTTGDGLTDDVVEAAGAEPGKSWGPELARLFDSRLIVLQQRGDLNEAVRTIIEAVAVDGQEEEVAVPAAQHFVRFAEQAWAESGALERRRLGDAARRLARGRKSRAVLEKVLERSFLAQLAAA